MQANNLVTGNTYADRRRWGDLYLPSMNHMAAELLQQNGLISPTFITPTLHEDQRLGIDQYCEWGRVKLSYRTRKFEALNYALNGFTLRRKGGTRSELHKVMAGTHADYLLYGIASAEDDGTLHAGILIDLKAVAAQLNQYHSILEQATWKPDFVDLNYDLFPEEICVGWFGAINKKAKETSH